MVKIYSRVLIAVSAFLLLTACSDSSDVSGLSSEDAVQTIDGRQDFIPADDSLSDIIDSDTATSDDSLFNESPDDEEQPPVVEEPPVEEEPPPVVEEPPVEEEEEEQPPVVEEPPAPVYQCVDRNYYSVKMLDGSDNESIVTSFDGPLSAKVNYNYYSWSAHSIVGPSPKEYEGNFFIHQGSDGVSFNFVYNVDAGGSPDNKVKMDVIIEGNDGKDKILISDDSAEIKSVSATADQKVISTTYTADLHYWSNTDGGALGPLSNKNFKVKVRIYYIGDNKEVAFHSADGSAVSLKLSQSTPTLFSEFEVTFKNSKEDCSLGAEEQITKNKCIDEKYQAVKEEIENADWQNKYDVLLEERKAAVIELKEAQLKTIAEKKKSYNDKMSEIRKQIKVLQVERSEKIKEIGADRIVKSKEIDVYYEAKINEITSKYKTDKDLIITELDAGIAEAKNNECNQKSFFARLWCKFVKFIKQLITKIVTFLRKCLGIYNGPVDANNAQDLENVKASALKQLSEQHEKTLKELVMEKKERVLEHQKVYKGKISETKSTYTEKIKSMKDEIVRLLKERNEVIKEMNVSYRLERKKLADALLKKIKQQRSEWIKKQNKVNKEFEESTKTCSSQAISG